MIMFSWDFGPYYSQHFIFALYSAAAKPSNHAMERTPKAFASRLADRCALHF
jgi:hypothetical protein